MKLPSSFTDYTRALLGVEEYEKLAVRGIGRGIL